MDNIEFTLEMNANDSLGEALNFFKKSKEHPPKIRITILLLDNFLELFLKKYISHTHPLFIYQKPSANDLKTLTLYESVNLIKKIGYELDDVFESRIVNLRKLRNDLQHNQGQLDVRLWREKIGEILYYSLRFNEQNDNLFDIMSHISQESWNEIVALKHVYEGIIAEAQEASFYGPNDDQPTNPQPLCPICGIYGTTHIENERQSAYCHACRDSFPIQQCSRCGEEKNLDEFSEDDEGNILPDCDGCWEECIRRN